MSAAARPARSGPIDDSGAGQSTRVRFCPVSPAHRLHMRFDGRAASVPAPDGSRARGHEVAGGGGTGPPRPALPRGSGQGLGAALAFAPIRCRRQHRVGFRDNVAEIASLVGRGVSVEARDNEGRTPLPRRLGTDKQARREVTARLDRRVFQQAVQSGLIRETCRPTMAPAASPPGQGWTGGAILTCRMARR